MLLRTTSRQAGGMRDFRKYWLLSISLVLVSIQIEAQPGWTRKRDMQPVRVAAAASVVNGKIYVMGGLTLGLLDINNNQAYDPSTDTWVTLAPMPTPRGFPFSGVVNDTIYVMGGGYPNATSRVEAYNPKTNSWNTTKADVLLARIASNAAVVDGTIYHIGGSYNQRDCQAYHTNPNFAELRTPIPDSLGQRGALSVTVYDRLIYTFGGSNYSPWSPFSAVCAYNPQADTWTRKRNMPTPRFGFQTYLIGNKIYAIGGSQSEGTALATVEVYDPVTDTWDTSRADMPRGFTWFAGAVVNNKIYVIGGTTDWASGGLELWEYDPAITEVVGSSELPKHFVLEQNFPNPFNPTTVVSYQLPVASDVRLAVYDMLGREVSVLVNERKEAGVHEVKFDGTSLASGVYFYRIEVRPLDFPFSGISRSQDSAQGGIQGAEPLSAGFWKAEPPLRDSKERNSFQQQSYLHFIR
jgi:N-acetylneuraminic acid mutarotase